MKIFKDGEFEPIVGVDHIVEIDEMLVSKKKYHKGNEVKENLIFLRDRLNNKRVVRVSS